MLLLLRGFWDLELAITLQQQSSSNLGWSQACWPCAAQHM
jgi:hypothetical protein